MGSMDNMGFHTLREKVNFDIGKKRGAIPATHVIQECKECGVESKYINSTSHLCPICDEEL